MKTYRLPAAIAAIIIGTLLPTQAQTIFVPGGTVGTSSNGNVGIGTASPGYKLDVNGTAQISGIWKFASNGVFYWGSSYGNGLLTWDTGYAAVQAQAGNALRLGVAGYYAAINVNTAGNVGIGTIGPVTKLHVDANSASGAFYMSNASLTAAKAFMGIAGGSSSIVNGDVLGDFCIVSNGPKLNISANNGTTPHLTILSTGGNVGIGTTNPTYPLTVNGTVRAKEVIVDTGWSDYVFDPGYRLAPLAEVELKIKTEKHLPGIPTAREVRAAGISVGDMQAKLLGKIEELTLHVIAQEKRIEKLEEENRNLRDIH
jgi:hypothetical protein